MQLKQYISEERGRASKLAKEIKVSPSYLSQMASGEAPISPKKSVEIEIKTGGLVSRKDTNADWEKIWPELKEQHPSSGC